MESAFGTSFSHVRAHTDAGAAALSGSLNARAFTVGEHIAFGSGEYKPGTLIGDAIIAHELAHVAQQGRTSSSTASMQKGGTGYSSLEEDADRSAVGAVVSLWSGAKGALATITQNAMPRLRSGLKLQRCCRDDKGSRYTQTFRQYGSAAFEACPYCACAPRNPCTQDRRPGPRKPDGTCWEGWEVEYEAGCVGCFERSNRHLAADPCGPLGTVGCR